MGEFNLKKLIIVGGGTAGWIAAAALAKFVGRVVEIELVESDQIGTVGVGEATIPQILRLTGMLGLDEADMMRASGATFKLGIEFNNWGRQGESYLHTFGHNGINFNHLDFHHYWLRALKEGDGSDFWDYSFHHKAAYAHKFGHINQLGKSGISGLSYAYHFDAGLFAQFLRRYAESQGVKRTEGKIVDVNLDGETGHVTSVKLEAGAEIQGDFFIDCSGFRGLLIGQALGVKYLDWSRWLPANRAVAVACERTDPLLPYTKATAHSAGWQWRIPLQHRTGNGHVFCSDFMSPEEAETILVNNLDAPVISEPKHLRFTTGRREKFFHKNCLALGLSSGFMEPLESTSIHLIQAGVNKLIEMFPHGRFSRAMEDEFNRQVIKEFDLIRDFLILHYHQTDREDSEFWRYCKNMDVPDTLKAKMALFQESGIIYKEFEDLFGEASWSQVMIGQGMRPDWYHLRANALSSEQLNEFLQNIQTIIGKAIPQMKNHNDYIAAYCPSDIQ